jgi:hypothetical protein
MNPLFRRAASAAFVLMLLVSAQAAGLEYPPGSRIGLVAPPGMTASTRIQGFEDRARGAVIAITELSGQSYGRVAQEFSREIMQTGGMEVLSRDEFDLPGGPAVIVAARQRAGGIVLRKWALAGLVGDLTVVVVASMPEAARDAYPDAAVRAALMSVMVRPKLSVDEMLVVLPYRLADLGGFRLMRATPTGTAVLTFGPNDTPLPVEQPYFMVAARPGEPPAAAEQDRFARRALAEFSARAPDRIVSSEPLRIGGASGHQIIAESRDERTGDELVMVQWLRFGADGFVQMFGIARKDRWAEMLPRMRAVRDGLGAK